MSDGTYRRTPKHAIKIDLPNVAQRTDYTCGASVLQAICAYFGVGPDDEADYERLMAMPKTGADPIHITTAATALGLAVHEFRPMTIRQLERCLDKRRPVILMLQAWDEGHYVVAVGYDADVIYVEDPWIQGSRGYLTRAELAARWHDVEGEHDIRTHRLGIALWRKKPTRRGYRRSARHVD